MNYERICMNCGFTLVEILITIMLIGVVATITITALLTNSKASRFKTQYKKTLSTLNQAVRMSEARYDINFSSSGEHPNGASDCQAIEQNGKGVCSIFRSTLKLPDFKIAYIYGEGSEDNVFGKTYKLTSTQTSMLDDDFYVSQFPDGTLIFVNFAANNCTLSDVHTAEEPNYSSRRCHGFIDVNGADLPNKEVKCTHGTTSKKVEEPCVVSNKDISDVFPIIFYDGTVAPGTNAANYVLQK